MTPPLTPFSAQGDASIPTLEVSGPGGWGVHVSGSIAMLVVLMLSFMGGLLWVNHLQHREIICNQRVLMAMLATDVRMGRQMEWLMSMPFDKRPLLPRPTDDLSEELVRQLTKDLCT